MAIKYESDDVLAQARAALANSSRVAGDTAKTDRKIEKESEKTFASQLRTAVLGISQATQGAAWIYNKVLKPVWTVLNPFVGWAVRGYGRLWNRVVNVKDEEGETVTSKKRAGALILATAFAAAVGVKAGPPVARELAWSGFSAGAWALSSQTENLVMNRSSDPIKGIYSAQGCHAWPCNSENTITFMVDDSLFHDAHRLLTRGELFLPDYVAGAVPDVPSICKVDYYSWRNKLVSRWGHIYPRLMSADDCVPVPHQGMPEGPIPQDVSPMEMFSTAAKKPEVTIEAALPTAPAARRVPALPAAAP